MKPVSELTNQELNEWVAREVFGYNCKWIKQPEHSNQHGNSVPLRLMTDSPPYSKESYAWLPMWWEVPDYCNDLNHTYLMEEKIREMGKEVEWGINLVRLILGYESSEEVHDLNQTDYFDLAHATARQKVEAAYLALNPEKELKSDK